MRNQVRVESISFSDEGQVQLRLLVRVWPKTKKAVPYDPTQLTLVMQDFLDNQVEKNDG
jgi:hypothetical protein